MAFTGNFQCDHVEVTDGNVTFHGCILANADAALASNGQMLRVALGSGLYLDLIIKAVDVVDDGALVIHSTCDNEMYVAFLRRQAPGGDLLVCSPDTALPAAEDNDLELFAPTRSEHASLTQPNTLMCGEAHKGKHIRFALDPAACSMLLRATDGHRVIEIEIEEAAELVEFPPRGP